MVPRRMPFRKSRALGTCGRQLPRWPGGPYRPDSICQRRRREVQHFEDDPIVFEARRAPRGPRCLRGWHGCSDAGGALRQLRRGQMTTQETTRLFARTGLGKPPLPATRRRSRSTSASEGRELALPTTAVAPNVRNAATQLVPDCALFGVRSPSDHVHRSQLGARHQLAWRNLRDQSGVFLPIAVRMLLPVRRLRARSASTRV
jgi:hypothetical protein